MESITLNYEADWPDVCALLPKEIPEEERRDYFDAVLKLAAYN